MKSIQEGISYVDIKVEAFGSGEGVERVQVQHGKFQCKRGYPLYTTILTPAVRRNPACLVFHHGLSDHSERHIPVLAHLSAALGMPVYTYDAHGHGYSGPEGPTSRALIRRFDHIVQDLLDFTTQLVVPAELQAAVVAGDLQPEACTTGAVSCDGGNTTVRRPRIFLMGYSMGGLACCLAVAESSSAAAAEAAASSLSYPSSCGKRAALTATAAGCGGGGGAAVNGCATACGERPAGTAASGGCCDGSDGAMTSAAAKGCSAANGCRTHESGIQGANISSSYTSCDGAHNNTNDKSSSGSKSDGGGLTGGKCPSGRLYEGLMLTSGLTNPLYGNHPIMYALMYMIVTVLSYIVPSLPLFRRRPVETGIRDPVAVAAMAEDTLWYRGNLRVATVASLLHGCRRLASIRRAITLPLYVQHATVDVACSLPSMRAFLGALRPASLTMHVVEGAYHDLHHDPETPVLLRHMVEWLRQQTGVGERREGAGKTGVAAAGC